MTTYTFKAFSGIAMLGQNKLGLGTYLDRIKVAVTQKKLVKCEATFEDGTKMVIEIERESTS